MSFTDAPIPVSRHNDVTVAFNERTASVFGPPGQEQTFSVAMRSFPTPAVFTWPAGFTQESSSLFNGHVTVVDVTVMIDDDATHVVSVRSGQNGLSSQITLELKLRGDVYDVDVK